jgi:hypothetical protein
MIAPFTAGGCMASGVIPDSLRNDITRGPTVIRRSYSAESGRALKPGGPDHVSHAHSSRALVQQREALSQIRTTPSNTGRGSEPLEGHKRPAPTADSQSR